MLATHGTAFYLGQRTELASQLEQDKKAEALVAKISEANAHAIAKIRPVYKTVQGKVETQIRENTIYRDCEHTPDGLRLVNEALTLGNSGVQAGHNSIAGPKLRLDDGEAR